MKGTRDGIVAVEASATVNDTIQKFPGTVRVFGAWGIDSCCGGALRLETVAERHGLDLGRLLAELTAAAGGPETGR